MVEDTSQEYAVPRYRDPEKTARIVEARRRGELYKDIAAREGVSSDRVQKICQDAGLTVRRSTTAPSHPCARAGCGKLLRIRSAVYCSLRCAGAARSPALSGRAFYERRRDTGAKWSEVAGPAPDRRSDLEPAKSVKAAMSAARRYAKARGLPWPLPGRPPPPKPCAWTECGKPVPRRSAVYCSRRCADAADPIGKHFYERRRDTGATWREIADAAAPDSRPDLEPAKRTNEARRLARRYAKARGLPWPLPGRPPPPPPPHPCAWTECGKLLRDSSAVYCSRQCAEAAQSSASPGKAFYERRRDTGAKWREIADAAPDRGSDLEPAKRAKAAMGAARRYARANGLPWPLPGRPPPPPPPHPCAWTECGKPVMGRSRSAVYCSRQCAVAARRAERMARRDEEGMAEVREMVEHERKVLALLDELPKDRTISRDEADRFLVELYRTGMRFSHIAKRTNCSVAYAVAVVRRQAPELVRPREPRGRGKKKPPLGPLLDFRELRKVWRFAKPGAPKNTWAISRREGAHDRERRQASSTPLELPATFGREG